MNRDYSDIRKDFTKNVLQEDYFSDNPIMHFKQWLNEAVDNNEAEPTAMTLSTVSKDGRPSGRILLLKNLEENGSIHFFTNYESKKGLQIQHNPYAAATFFWPVMERQIRVEGIVHKLSEEESNKYFNSRPIDSQISAIVSPQSKVIASREKLEKESEKLKNSGNEKLQRPEYWGGYKLIPQEIEFWQGRAGRLHDRIRFSLSNNQWTKERLAP